MGESEGPIVRERIAKKMEEEHMQKCKVCGTYFPTKGTICPSCQANNQPSFAPTSNVLSNPFRLKRNSHNDMILNNVRLVIMFIGGIGFLMLAYSMLSTWNGSYHSVEELKNLTAMYDWGLVLTLGSIIAILTMIQSRLGLFEME